MPFGKLQAVCHVHFTEERLPSGLFFWKFLPFFSADPLKLCQDGWGTSLHNYFQVSPEMFDRVLVPAAEKDTTTMLHRRDGARLTPDVMLGIQAKEFNLDFIRPKNLVSHVLRVL